VKELGGKQGRHGIDREAGERETEEISRFYTRRGRVAGGGKGGAELTKSYNIVLLVDIFCYMS